MTPKPADRRAVRFWAVVIAVVLAGLGVYAYLNRATPTGPAYGHEFVGPPVPAPTRPTLRLATFNIDSGRGADGHVNLTRTVKSLQRLDLIALQEVRSDLDQPTTLSTLLGLPVLDAPAEQRWGRDTFGNAVLTNLPVLHWQRVVLPAGPFAAKRNYVQADLTWLGRPLHVIATHVDYKSGGDEQLAIVIRAFLDLPEPAVLMGDLNHPADSPPIKQLMATPGVRECYSRMPQLDPVPGRVDWIFVRGLRPVDAGVVDMKASDHPAYWAVVARQ